MILLKKVIMVLFIRESIDYSCLGFGKIVLKKVCRRNYWILI